MADDAGLQPLRDTTALRQKLRARIFTAPAAPHDWQARSGGHLVCHDRAPCPCCHGYALQ
jgi:hypothetical protein